MGDSLQTSVRAKLRLTQVTETAYGSKILRFDCQYDETIPEDRRFQKATPHGNAELYIDNPMALGQFKLGDTYYVDFTNAPKP